MSHVTLKEILKDTRDRKYAVPNLAACNLEMLIGIIKAAEEKKAPVIICYNKQLSHGIPIELAMPLLVNAAERAKVPIATILDHGSDFKDIVKSIHYSSSSVMFDGSGLSFEENIKRTKEIVKIAHSIGVSVEAELGGVGGSAVEKTATSSAESIATKPEEAVEFVNQTKIDALAIAFGNVHGRYKGEPKIDLELVKKIASLIDIPLVMHGASGLTLDSYKPIIESGISKINYFSAMCRGIYSKMKDLLESTGEDAFCIDTIQASIVFWYQETKKLLDILNCSGKASKSFMTIENKDDYSNSRLIETISETVYNQIKTKMIK